MVATISVSDLSRDLKAILDQVRRERDSFVIEEDGQAVARLGPIVETATWASLSARVRQVPQPDSQFAFDLEQIQRQQPDVPTAEWPS